MRKYLALFKISFIQSLTYRAEIVLWILLDIFPTIVVVATWLAIYQGNVHPTTITLSQLITYYLSVLVITNLAETHFEDMWVENVMYGKIDHFFTKPIHFIAFMFIRQLASKVFSIFTFVLPFSVFLVVLSNTGIIQLPHITLPVIGLFLGFIVVAFFVNAMLSCFVVMASFWFDEARSLGHAKWILSGVFGGALAPMILYPQWVKTIANYLPFQRLVYVPATLLSQAKTSVNTFQEFFILVGFALLLYALLMMTWKKAVQKYTSAGG